MHEHIFEKSTKYDNYEVCIDCGTFHSTAQIDPKIIYENNYWDEGDGKTGRSTIEQQVSNFNCIDDCGISKADRVMQFVPKGEIAIEAACAPGVILNRLLQFGYSNVIGVEPNQKYIQFICNQAPGANVIHGYFPQVFSTEASEFADCFLALDLAEHIEDYDNFFKSIHRILKPGGTAIIMSPIILSDGLLRHRDMEHPGEHCWIWTEIFLSTYLKSIFKEVEFRRWLVGHEIVCLKK